MKKIGIILALIILGIIGSNIVFWCLTMPSSALNVLAVIILFVLLLVFNYIIQTIFKS